MLPMIRKSCTTVVILVGILSANQVPPLAVAAEKTVPAPVWLDTALTFHASFDHGPDADLGKGDRRLFTAPSLNDRKDGRPGLPENGAVSVIKGHGRFGDALQFHRTAADVVFFQVQQNLLYSNANWNGSVSFWLKLDPNKDLPPGYCDPLFITPRTFNDGALWVDFNDKSPRHFRHGAIPDRKIWDPNLQDFDKIPEAERPLVTVTQPPFSAENWTHIVIAFTDFNTGKPNGVSRLYINGVAVGSVPSREQTYTWNVAEATAVMGISYIGLFDELSFFNRELTAAEVQELYELPDGVSRVR
ncbi:MAG: LamG-like jellyroll fold domain-containing protein [Planctomycetaceae bacterium]